MINKIMDGLRNIGKSKALGNDDDVNPKSSTNIDEHFVPMLDLSLESYLGSGDISGVHHLIRYRWAIDVLKEYSNIKAILDVACGSGYGTYLVAKQFPNTEVLGVDYDCMAVETANKTYSLPNLGYKCGDVTKWDSSIGPQIYSTIISFDTLEHVSHRDIMMENLVEHLDKYGTLLLSTPCGAVDNILQPEWEFHKLEYSASSLYDFLNRYFSIVIRPEETAFPQKKTFDCLEGTDTPYLLRLNPVVCKSPVIITNPYKKY